MVLTKNRHEDQWNGLEDAETTADLPTAFYL